MNKQDFNSEWTYSHLGENDIQKITLPHDAMLSEPRTAKSLGTGNVGWFEGKDYQYEKKFNIPDSYADKNVFFEFEGVYHNAEVYINDRYVTFRPYGYINFYFNADEYLKYGEENTIKVIAHNSDQPNSRWYSGAGIYRPVWIYAAPKKHICMNGVKIKTLSINPARIQVDISTEGEGNLQIDILENDRVCASIAKNTQEGKSFVMDIPDAKLWSTESPFLYKCRVCFEEDSAEENFGIRTLEWNPENGMTINGERVILKGACIHHDNGVLGACAFPEAEERKVRIMKECGYNALRSAHNPCSKAMLDACDRLGMLMMDEYVDVWYIHKTQYDYILYLEEWWHQDLRDIVDKDYNHPSVIMYSTGNEVSETAQKEGIELTKKFTEYLHKLDDSRPVSCGVNIFFNFLSSMGFGVYSDEKAEKQLEKAEKAKSAAEIEKKKKPVGSEFFNTLSGILGDTTMKVGATLYPCDLKTRDAYANMDIAGYNYGIFRYKHDLKKYPKRLILGSETFCNDAYRFYELAKKNPRIIGDFVWAGMDYIGEVGIGSWEYEDYAPKNAPKEGWLTAGSGRVNILGKPIGEAAYTQVALEACDKPRIAVKPVYQTGKHSPSAWKMTDAMESWSWRGCDGYPARVEVYARAALVELYINDVLVGKKKLNRSKTCNTVFNTKYHDGTITVKAYDESGRLTGVNSLTTAGEKTVLKCVPEQDVVSKDGLIFLPMQYTDEKGVWKPMEKHTVKVRVEGGKLIGLGSACPYNPQGYLLDSTPTYYGEALAVVRADKSSNVKIIIEDESKEYVVNVPNIS